MDEVSLYYFGNVSNTWPGKAMKKDVSGKYYVDVPKIPTEGDTTPMQVNMHVGLSYDNVNLTYTTKGPADVTVTVKDADGKIINTFNCDSNYSYLSSKFTHTATITDLSPKTEYTYTVNSGSKDFTGHIKAPSVSKEAKDKISSKTYTLKYDTDTDAVTKEPEIYDSEIKIKLSRKKAK